MKMQFCFERIADMRKVIPGTVFLTAATLLLSYSPPDPDTFLEKPYLQLGDVPKLSSSESLVLLWHTTNHAADWKVELRTSKDTAWRAAGAKATKIERPVELALRDGHRKVAGVLLRAGFAPPDEETIKRRGFRRPRSPRASRTR